jgi:hypothetical protein
MSRRSLLVGAGLVGLGAAGGLFAWWPGGTRVSHAYTLAPESALPSSLRSAPPEVREAYRFAIDNREVLRKIPCYCACGDQHQSNAECYIKEVKADGRVVFDLMSYG